MHRAVVKNFRESLDNCINTVSVSPVVSTLNFTSY